MKTNVHAFKRLIKRYESISLKEVEKTYTTITEKDTLDGILTKGEAVTNKLTGFGNSRDCTLCKALGGLVCERCLHSNKKINVYYTDRVILACVDNIYKKSYYVIGNAQNPQDLHKAIKDRAKDLRKLLKQLGYKQPK